MWRWRAEKALAVHSSASPRLTASVFLCELFTFFFYFCAHLASPRLTATIFLCELFKYFLQHNWSNFEEFCESTICLPVIDNLSPPTDPIAHFGKYSVLNFESQRLL